MGGGSLDQRKKVLEKYHQRGRIRWGSQGTKKKTIPMGVLKEKVFSSLNLARLGARKTPLGIETEKKGLVGKKKG